MKRAIFILASVVVCHWSIAANASAQHVVTASQVNGTWSTHSGECKILALGHGQLRVEFSGTTGGEFGVAHMAGDTATFTPETADYDCAIKMRFAGGRLIVKQEGDCGPGHNVVSGTYHRVSSSKPTFSPH